MLGGPITDSDWVWRMSSGDRQGNVTAASSCRKETESEGFISARSELAPDPRRAGDAVGGSSQSLMDLLISMEVRKSPVASCDQ